MDILTASAVLCLAHAVWHEGRGEPLAGQFAVAQVVMERVRRNEDRWGGADVCGVVYHKGQFTGMLRSGLAYDEVSLGVALIVYNGGLGGGEGLGLEGATHFYAYRGENGLGYDPWPELETVKDIGNHRFKREGDKR